MSKMKSESTQFIRSLSSSVILLSFKIQPKKYSWTKKFWKIRRLNFFTGPRKMAKMLHLTMHIVMDRETLSILWKLHKEKYLEDITLKLLVSRVDTLMIQQLSCSQLTQRKYFHLKMISLSMLFKVVHHTDQSLEKDMISMSRMILQVINQILEKLIIIPMVNIQAAFWLVAQALN